MNSEPLAAEFLGMSRVPARGSAEFASWIEQRDFLAMLARNARDPNVVLYASILPGPYVHSVLVPLKHLRPVDRDDLRQWNDCRPYSSWSISWSQASGGKSARVRLSPPLGNSGSKTIDQAEQIVFARHFDGRQEEQSYIEIAQTLTHPHDLHYVHERRAYCRFDDDGDLEPVVRVIALPEPGHATGRIVTITRDVLDRHLFATGTALVRVFDSPRVDLTDFSSWGDHDESTIDDQADEIYARFGKNASVGSFVRGAQVIRCGQPRSRMLRMMAAGWRRRSKKYVSFIALDFKNRRIRKCSCNPRRLASYFISSELPFETTPAFFKPEVLLKYKSDPDKYQLTDRSISCRNAWHLQAYGLNDAGQVHSYLVYLGRLPYSEQLHWQSFNERPKSGLSEATYRREFLGEFVEDDNPLRRLKRALQELGKQAPSLWKCKDDRLFGTIHPPVTASEKEWSAEIVELAKLMVEGFETAYLRNKARTLGVKDPEKLASIALIEGILNAQGWEEDAVRPIVDPLKEVQRLRTRLGSHASGVGARPIVAEAIKRHGSLPAHFRALASESESAVRQLIDYAARGVL